MRTTLVVLLLVVSLQHAVAQPVDRPLTRDDAAVLERGEMSVGVAAATNWLAGFGVGHALQGRWLERGWMFTAGEAVGAGFIIHGLQNLDCFLICAPQEIPTSAAIGIGIVAATRLASIVDAVVAGSGHNRRVRELRARTASPTVAPYVAPLGDGVSAGLVLRL